MLAAARQVISNDRAARSSWADSGWVAAVHLLLHTAPAVVFAGCSSTGPSNGIGVVLFFTFEPRYSRFPWQQLDAASLISANFHRK